MITCPGNQTESADASCELNLPDYTAMATAVSDNCDATPTVTQLPVAGTTVSGAGTIETITLTATDASGNSLDCTFDVNVEDDTDPSANCQDHTLVLDASGSATLVVTDIDNSSIDNCGIDTYALDQTSFNCSNIGTNTVNLTVEDLSGNASSCSATVTVEDNEIPVITCPADITLCAEDVIGATVSYTAASGSDNCTFNIVQTDVSGVTSGDVFLVGSTVQEWTITDAGGNSASCDFTVTVNATPVANYSFSAACQGESTFFTDLTTINPGYSITSWEWDMDDGSSSIGLVDPIHAFGDTGMYDVELVVISAEGCSDTTVQSVHVTPVPVAGFTFTGACEGNATVFTNTSTVESGNLNYAWDFGDSNTSPDESPSHTYVLDGTYTVTLTVTSDNGCEDISVQSVTVNDSPTALFSASTECEGTATVFTNLSTGDGVLTYSWNFGDSSPLSTDVNPTYTYATDGTYTVVLTVTNDNFCVNTSTVSVVVNNLPNADFTFSDVCEGTPADFVNTSDAGTYNWDLGDGNSSTLTDVSHAYDPFGSYDVTLTVTSPEFCLNSVTQTIEIFDLPDFTITPTDVLCYGESTGQLIAVAIPPSASPWTLSIDGGTPQASVTFGGLEAGTYDITAFDSNGCQFTVTGAVNQPSDTLGIDVNGLVDILCNGATTGEIDINGIGGTAPYMYSVNAGTPQASGIFAGLEAAIHAIQIVDANLCVFDTLITLSEPDTLINTLVNADDLLCNGDNSGAIAVVGTGGVIPYEYNLDGAAYGTDSTFTGLAAATYVVGVRDANGCTDTLHVTLTEPGILQLSLISVSDAICYQESNGSIEVEAASGTPPYQYSLDGVNFQGTGLFEGLAAGTYTLTVMDANGCLDDLTETVFEPSELTIETNSTPVACFGDATGEIEIIANGGTSGYEYSLDGGASFDPNGGLFTNVVMGNYLTVVQDANGCTASEGVIISQPASVFILDADVTDAACLDSTSGSIQLIGTGGSPTYVYSSDNASFSSISLFEGYGAGTYTLYAQDLNGCSDSIDVTVGQPGTSVEITTTLLANPACPNEASGTATIQAIGGTPGYLYSSDGGTTYQVSQILAGLNGGNHLVMVQDANGCVDSDTITLVTPGLMDITLDSIIGVECEGDLTGEIHVTGVGGTPSYNYFLDGGSLQTNGDYIGLTNGTYSVSIIDVNGCAFVENVVIEATQMLPVANFGFSISGTAVGFTNTSGFGTTYLWEFGDDSTSTEMSPVHVYAEDGDYMVTLTVTNECGSDSITLLVSTTTIGISDNERVSFGIYPNPASTEIFIQPSKTVNSELTIDVISTSGQLIQSAQSVGINVTDKIRIDVNGLSNGIYYLRIVGNEQQSVLRFDIIK
jgi:PKD repeat protein